VSGFYCDTSGTPACDPQKATGASCVNDFECTKGACVTDDAGPDAGNSFCN
jgi:hypothetical protein